jgi:DNA-binding transcriptional LysR family regulator
MEESMSAELKLAAPTGISETILMRAIRELMGKHPGLAVVMKDGTTPDVTRYLADGFVRLTLQGKDIKGEVEVGGKKVVIETRPIAHQEENVLAVPIGDLLALKEALTKEELADVLSRRIVIGREEGSGVHEKCREYLAKQGLQVLINDEQFVVRSLEGSVRAVAAGIGVAILPKGTVEEICPRHIKGIRLPPGPGDKRLFYVAWRAGYKLSDLERELCAILGVSDLPNS